MIVIRLLVALLVLALGGALLTWLITRDRRWLRFAWQVLRFGVVFLVVLAAFYLLERLIIVI